MGKRASASFKFDKKAQKFFAEIDRKMPLARETAVKAMGVAWADGAKGITQSDDHIDTGAYVNSIGYETNIPGKNGIIQKGTPINDTVEKANETILTIGSDVRYAAPLEKRYNIMARSLDANEKRMLEVGSMAVRKTILGK